MDLKAILQRDRVPWWKQPCQRWATWLYAKRQGLVEKELPTGTTPKIAIVCISDTHNKQPDLPPGDVLIHAGDLTGNGTIKEIQDQLDWLNAQLHQHKIVIAGNHDLGLDEAKSGEVGISSEARRSLRWGSINYLERSNMTLTTVGGRKLNIHGNPWTRKQGNWAFQYEKGTDMFTDEASDDVDIMVTHSPPRFHLDDEGWGEDFISRELWRTRPRLHIFGHIHEGYGRDVLVYDEFERSCEYVCAGGILRPFTLVKMAEQLSWMWVTGPNTKSQKSILVNASIAGVRCNDKLRSAHVISL